MDGGAWFRSTLSSKLDVPDENLCDVVQLKGYGSGMDHGLVMEASKEQLRDHRVVVVDGDWYKADSFVASAEHVLSKPGSCLVMFRKPTPPDHKVWSTYEPILTRTKARALHVVVPVDTIAKEEGLVSKVPDVTDPAYTALGHLTIRVCRARTVLAIGGGETTVNEYRACLHFGYASAWKVVDVPRNGRSSDLVTLFHTSQILQKGVCS